MVSGRSFVICIYKINALYGCCHVTFDLFLDICIYEYSVMYNIYINVNSVCVYITVVCGISSRIDRRVDGKK